MERNERTRSSARERSQDAHAFGRAAARGAAGDWAGAAAEAGAPLLHRVLSLVLIGALAFGILCVLFLYSLPTVIFEAVQTFFGHLADTYDEVLFSGQYGSASDSAGTALRITAGEALRNAWNAVFHTGEDSAVLAAGTDAPDLYITQSEQAETDTLHEKITAASDKLRQRAEDLAGQILYALRGQYAGLSGEYTEPDGTVVSKRIEFLADTSSVTGKSAALDLLALYTVQTGASVSGSRLSDFQQWLGYDPGTFIPSAYVSGVFTDGYRQLLRSGLKHLRETSVRLQTVRSDGSPGSTVTIRLTPWYGTCLPQYAVDRARYEASAFGRPVTPAVTGCAAVDLYLVAEIPDPETVQGIACEYTVPVTVRDRTSDGGFRTVQERHRDIVYPVTVRIRPRGMEDIFRILGLAGTYEEK